MIELLAVMTIGGIVSAIALPAMTRTYADLRMRGDSRALHNSLSVAKMRAAARFSRERLYIDLATESFRLQFWDKAAANWVDEGGTTQLSSGVDFGVAALANPPVNTQAVLGQAPPCQDNAVPPVDIANTACIVFNSRGIPISSNGEPFGNNAIYIRDDVGVSGITLSASGLLRRWWSPTQTEAWVRQ